MATVKLSDVRKSFGKNEVIHGIDLDIADGEFIVIVGPSGCGKSTLLRMVAGLETVSSGEIHIDGRRVNDLEPMERDIAMVFQNYALYPHMNVYDNMAYGLRITGKPKEEIRERVHQAAALLQIEDYLERKPRELSGGQRQRVAMGRAIVRKPAVFLFDEPLSNLDAKLRVQMRLEIKQLQKELGVTSLYVTHDQVEAMTLADRVIIMNEGRAEQVGTPLELYANPATRFVGGFIGSPPMNFIKVQERRLGDYPLRPDADSIGIRPEHMRFVNDGAKMLGGRVKFLEALGAETLVHVELENGNLVTVRQPGSEPAPEAGSMAHLAWSAEDTAQFNSEGQRVDR
ncbi:ABC transporter ATP-binding protein [Nitratireductor basaltis]|uniref:ABC transporter related protein n=1 Tax=Nitratireductor basaltis TaxID=472175 RepID=A0A084U8P8_9HYPH|nr:sn-glycerol-3-phosphate ABC transporter ATP-binding protein UgpC [Nitratireductor basaltis]KFB09334.1 ABC transporter related protein [Nitratireductor basaltis]